MCRFAWWYMQSRLHVSGTLVQVQTSRGYDYNRRRRYEERSRYTAFPLPAKTLHVQKKDILNAVSNRQRHGSVRVCWDARVLKILKVGACVLFLVLFLFIMSLLLFYSGNECRLSEWYVQFCDNLWHYYDLDESVQIVVTNQTFAFLCFCSCAALLFSAILWFNNKC